MNSVKITIYPPMLLLDPYFYGTMDAKNYTPSIQKNKSL